MMKFLTAMILAVVTTQGMADPAITAPAVGDMAPHFNLPASDGLNYNLDQFRGNKPVVIAFFPKVFTGG